MRLGRTSVFSLGGTELLVIGLAALLLFGPEKLPQFARTIGRFTREFNKYRDILESTVRAEVYRAERQDETTKLDAAKARGAAAKAAEGVGVKADPDDDVPVEAPAEEPSEPSAVESAEQPVEEPAPVEVAPVQSPAAVAATSEDEEDEG
jgi:sec-independent protein translocase protein TatB